MLLLLSRVFADEFANVLNLIGEKNGMLKKKWVHELSQGRVLWDGVKTNHGIWETTSINIVQICPKINGQTDGQDRCEKLFLFAYMQMC